MNYKFSKREVKLLYLLMCLLIVVLGWYFMVEPSLREANVKESELTALEIQRDSTKKSYEEYASAKENLVLEKEKQEVMKAMYLEFSENEDLDQMLTGLALRYHLTPLSLEIEPFVAADSTAYLEEQKKEDVQEPIVYSANVNMNIAGSMNNVLLLADEVKQSSYCKFKSLNYIQGDEDKPNEMRLSFVVYMVKK